MIVEHLSSVVGCVGVADLGDGQYRLDFVDGERFATAQEIAAARLAQVTQQIKDAARMRILAALPEWKQANATARAVELVAAGQASGPEWEAMQAAWSWVKAVRQHSDALEAQAAQMDNPLELDITSGWPA